MKYDGDVKEDEERGWTGWRGFLRGRGVIASPPRRGAIVTISSPSSELLTWTRRILEAASCRGGWTRVIKGQRNLLVC